MIKSFVFIEEEVRDFLKPCLISDAVVNFTIFIFFGLFSFHVVCCFLSLEIYFLVGHTVSLYYLLHLFSYLYFSLQWFNLLQTGRILTVRDLLSWVSFINVSAGSLPAESAFVHGAFLVLLDGLSLGIFASFS